MDAAERPEVREFSERLEMLPEPLALKARALREVLTELADAACGLALAYSGGLDSRFLAFFASSLQIPVRLLHVTGPHVPEIESRAALESARAMGFERIENFDEARGRLDRTIELLALDPLTNDAIFTSGTDRCYVCKSTLFRLLKDRAAPLPLADGTNASDLGVYRPGLRALRELGIRSPLADADVAKDEIRALGRALGLADPEQAARPCLLTRYPYGVRPTHDELALLADAEAFLEAHPAREGRGFRLRRPEATRTLLQLDSGGNAEEARAALEVLLAALAETFGARLPGLTGEVTGKVSGWFDRKRDS
ncbi:adenine nucleotide alpha-hydrolase family protein [Sutterella megalosphaeroides]|uniref:Asparagine synthetase domain-containing protein n=1 Tax=Sutterella megalosphaeroides TaxID=2494234 RepID=A0A2Z6I9J9_9BURK|nr:hypothetical protein [Sutterella megalosphaeroides]BBF23171.1 hypothetical protein SUTMEG_10620 [Sutterella megalosphaeroides]